MAEKSSNQNLNEFFKGMAEVSEESKKWEEYVRNIVAFWIQKALAYLQSTSEKGVTVRQYGSSAEGLKCYLPHDIGDVDLVIFPTTEEMRITEDMLENIDGKPGFVRINGNGHPLLNRSVFKDSEEQLVTTATLKKMHPEIFGKVSDFAQLAAKLQEAIAGKDNPVLANCISQFTNSADGPAATMNFAQSFDSLIKQDESFRDESCYHNSPAALETYAAFLCGSRGVPYTREHAVLFNSYLENCKEQIQRIAGDGQSLLTEYPRFVNEVLYGTRMQELVQLREQLESRLAVPQSETGSVGNESTETGSTQIKSTGTESAESEAAKTQSAESGASQTGIETALLDSPYLAHLFNVSETDVKDESSCYSAEATTYDRIGGVDFVPAFQGRGWPEVAQEWCTRPRQWPSHDVVEKITRESFHVVVKTPKTGGNPDLDFRLSFSHAEYLLSQEMNVVQKECYRCLKLFYRAFFRTDEKLLISYHLKNLLLWTAEETGLEFWSEENRASCVLMLLDKLQNALSSKVLPHYFIRSCNLFEHAASEHPDLLESLVAKVESICQDPTCFKWEMVLEKSEPSVETADGVQGGVRLGASAAVAQSVPPDKQQDPSTAANASAARPVSSEITSPAVSTAQSAASGLHTDLASAAHPPLSSECHLSYHDFQDLYVDTAGEIADLALSGAEVPTDDPILGELESDMRAMYEKHPELTVENFVRMFKSTSTMAYAAFQGASDADIMQRILRELKGWMKMFKFCSDQDLLSPGNEEAIVQRLFDPSGGFDLSQVIPAGCGVDLVRGILNFMEPTTTGMDLAPGDIPLD